MKRIKTILSNKVDLLFFLLGIFVGVVLFCLLPSFLPFFVAYSFPVRATIYLELIFAYELKINFCHKYIIFITICWHDCSPFVLSSMNCLWTLWKSPWHCVCVSASQWVTLESLLCFNGLDNLLSIHISMCYLWSASLYLQQQDFGVLKQGICWIYLNIILNIDLGYCSIQKPHWLITFS